MVHFIQVVIPRGLIKWYTSKKEQRSTDSIFHLEVSEDSAHGEGVIQVLDAKESALDIYKVRVANCRCYVQRRNKGLYVLLSRTQAGAGRTVKLEQEEISRNHVQTFICLSVVHFF